MERPIKEDFKSDSIYDHLKIFNSDKYIDKLNEFIDQIETEKKELIDVLDELCLLMNDVVIGDYIPDIFTTQPANILLKKLKAK